MDNRNQPSSDSKDSNPSLVGGRTSRPFYQELGFKNLAEYLDWKRLPTDPLAEAPWIAEQSVFDDEKSMFRVFDEASAAIYRANRSIQDYSEKAPVFFIDWLLENTSKDSAARHGLRVLKGFAPHLVPIVMFLVTWWSALIFLILNLPTIGYILVPKLLAALRRFYDISRTQGFSVALVKLAGTLKGLFDEAYEKVLARIQQINTIEELEEVIGEAIGVGLITFQTGMGTVQLARTTSKASARFTIQTGSKLKELAKSSPTHLRQIPNALKDATEKLTQNLSQVEFTEFIKRVQARAKSPRQPKDSSQSLREQLKQGLRDKHPEEKGNKGKTNEHEAQTDRQSKFDKSNEIKDSAERSGLKHGDEIKDFTNSLKLRKNSVQVPKSKYDWKEIADNAGWRRNELNQHAWERHPGLAKAKENQLPDIQLYDARARQTIRDADIVVERTKGDVLFIDSNKGLATGVQQTESGWKINSYRIQTLDP